MHTDTQINNLKLSTTCTQTHKLTHIIHALHTQSPRTHTHTHIFKSI